MEKYENTGMQSLEKSVFVEIGKNEKLKLSNIWAELIVSGAEVPEGVENFNTGKLKAWMFESLMEDVASLAHEYGLVANTDLIEKIKNSISDDKKTEAELEYMYDAHKQVDDIVVSRNRNISKSGKWDSWPKIIKESGNINCVGATLLGQFMIDQAGIESVYANPHGHVLNIVKTSDKQLHYFDFRNGDAHVFPLEAENIEIEGESYLKTKDKRTDYQLIRINDKQEIIRSIIGNLVSLKNTALYKNSKEDSTTEAKRYYKKHQEVFDSVDLEEIFNKLFPDNSKLKDSPLIAHEVSRVRVFGEFDDLVSKNLKKSGIDINDDEVLEDIGKHQSEICSCLGSQENLPKNIDSKAKQFHKILSDSLRVYENHRHYSELLDRIILRIKNV